MYINIIGNFSNFEEVVPCPIKWLTKSKVNWSSRWFSMVPCEWYSRRYVVFKNLLCNHKIAPRPFQSFVQQKWWCECPGGPLSPWHNLDRKYDWCILQPLQSLLHPRPCHHPIGTCRFQTAWKNAMFLRRHLLSSSDASIEFGRICNVAIEMLF